MKDILSKKESKIWNYIENVFATVANYYNYDYLKVLDEKIDVNGDFEEEWEKVYFINKKEFGIIAFNKDSEIIAEVISFAYRFLEELGLDVEVKLNIEQKDYPELISYLDYLDIDYVITNEKASYLFRISGDNEEELIKGDVTSNRVYFIGSIPSILTNLITENKLNTDSVDILVIAQTKEELLSAIPLVQSLRWSEIKCDLNNQSKPARINIIINEEDLKKGLITVRDNATNEEEKIDESVIIDYILSIL